MEPTREEKSRKRKKKRVKKMRAMIAKLIPIAVAIVLIIAIGGIYYGRILVENIYYNSDRKDLTQFYELVETEDVAVFVQNSYVPQKAKLINGSCYFNQRMIDMFFGNRFYINMEEGVIMYTTQTDIYEARIGEETRAYTVGGEEVPLNVAPAVLFQEEVYVSLEFLQLFESFLAEFYPDPNRLLLYIEQISYPVAVVKRDTRLRVLGGVKSEIVADVSEEDNVLVLEEMEKWTKVLSTDGFMGYVENRYIEKSGEVKKEPVKETIEDGYITLAYEGKVNMGFHQVFSEKANDTLGSYSDNTSGMNVISPTWFRISNNDGTLESIASKSYVEEAHARNMKVWALCTDVDYEVDMEAVLGVTQKRRVLVSQLINYALEYNLDGINIDFETIGAATGDDFVQFLRELSIQAHANSIVLSVDNYAPTASTAHYDRPEQGIVADYVVVMGYDEHWGGSEIAGSVASIDFVEGGIQKTIEEGVPANKVINAIPFYTRLWKTENGKVTSEAMGMEAAMNWVNKNAVELIWDNQTCQYYGELQDGNAYYQIWMEEEESIQTKLNVMESNHVAGVAAWKLGFEKKEIWDIIQAYINS